MNDQFEHQGDAGGANKFVVDPQDQVLRAA